MSTVEEWKRFWKEKAETSESNFEYDRGRSPREREIESLSTRELVEFVDPKPLEIIFDAGCGTGVNILLLHSKVKRMIGMDYTEGAIERCKKRIYSSKINNVELLQGSITNIPIPDCSVSKVLCMSVLQYLDDTQVRTAFKEFVRILVADGVLVLHAKNLSSLYLSTLWLAKKLKSLVRKRTSIEFLRSFKWYVKELSSLGFEVEDYNSFNLLMIELMPRTLLLRLQKLELQNYNKPFLRAAFIRRHGSDLKIKARIRKPSLKDQR
jgi:ubiquinone/menaquinone biosynthesis C-methylase UbiE